MKTRFVLVPAVLTCHVGCSDEIEKPADMPTVAAAVSAPQASANDITQGQAVYVQSCLQCHQHDGGGVPGMQPPMIENAAVAGDPSQLIEIVLRGVGSSEKAMPASGEYAMVMPAAATLSDLQISQVLTYIRQAFADSGPIKPEEVAAVRAKLE